MLTEEEKEEVNQLAISILNTAFAQVEYGEPVVWQDLLTPFYGAETVSERHAFYVSCLDTYLRYGINEGFVEETKPFHYEKIPLEDLLAEIETL